MSWRRLAKTTSVLGQILCVYSELYRMKTLSCDLIPSQRLFVCGFRPEVRGGTIGGMLNNFYSDSAVLLTISTTFEDRDHSNTIKATNFGRIWLPVNATAKQCHRLLPDKYYPPIYPGSIINDTASGTCSLATQGSLDNQFPGIHPVSIRGNPYRK